MEKSQQQVLQDLADAERRDGWLPACEAAGRFFHVTVELADALAEVLRGLSEGPILEICAGRGELAAALRRRGCPVVATDAALHDGAGVIRLDAREALRRYRPTLVLGCFVPTGEQIDQAVLAQPEVRDYVILNARLGPTCGDSDLWNMDGWHARPLGRVAERLVTRHDVWLGNGHEILRRGEAWHLQKVGNPASDRSRQFCLANNDH